MSAIGSVVFLKRQAFADVVESAAAVRCEHMGRGPFKKFVTYGREAFDHAWAVAFVEEVAFAFSGDVLGNYLDAHQSLSGFATADLEGSVAARALANVFTAAIPLDHSVSLPELPPEALHAFCVSEYGSDSEGMFKALQAADTFYRAVLQRVSPEHIAVVLIN